MPSNCLKTLSKMIFDKISVKVKIKKRFDELNVKLYSENIPMATIIASIAKIFNRNEPKL